MVSFVNHNCIFIIIFTSSQSWIESKRNFVSSFYFNPSKIYKKFLGLSGPSFCFSPAAFNAPVKKLDKSTYEKFISRLKLNFSFFLSNYALLTIGVGLVTALTHPGMIVSVAMLWALWTLHYFLISNELVIFRRNVGSLISISHRSNILIALTAFVIVWKCLRPTMTVISVSFLIILFHAMLRDPSDVTREFQTGADTRTHSNSSSSDSDETHDSEVLVDTPWKLFPSNATGEVTDQYACSTSSSKQT